MGNKFDFRSKIGLSAEFCHFAVAELIAVDVLVVGTKSVWCASKPIPYLQSQQCEL
jgi:hypothetical protein